MASAPPVLPMHFYTWNTQGSFLREDKVAQLSAFLPNDGEAAIVFVQEGGVSKAAHYEHWSAIGGAAVGAFNERCTNYVLVNNKWLNLPNASLIRLPLPTQTATASNQTVLVGGGVAGRTPAALAVGRLLLVSWHSIAGESNSDSAAVFGAFQHNPWYIDRFDRIIIGGDFNASPEDIASILNQKADKDKPYWTWVVNSGQVTHPSTGKEIDFFVIFDCTQYFSVEATVIQTAASDHDAVRMDIT